MNSADATLEAHPKPRRRWLYVFMSVILLFFVLGGLAIRSYIASSDEYARDTIPRLLMTWDREALRRELNAEKFSDADVVHIAELGPNDLGRLQRIRLPRATFSNVQISGKTYVRMCYAIPAVFEKRSAGIIFAIANIGGTWQIVEFDCSDDTSGNNLFKP